MKVENVKAGMKVYCNSKNSSRFNYREKLIVEKVLDLEELGDLVWFKNSNKISHSSQISPLENRIKKL